MVTNNTSDRSHAPEFHGFVAWTSTALLFVLYFLWALLPDEFIIWLGIRWYPNREWAVLFPSWTVALFVFTYFAYSMLAIARTPSFNDTSSIRDPRPLICQRTSMIRFWQRPCPVPLLKRTTCQLE
ncbi:hypothetical protein AX14_012904 [Amanita brunnescens Koide BX004]|nr:hypothetical protein AX14_012904 [Amanita brunnescens Koide BX004]